ncbi:MAG: hypothetical protein LBE79_07685 [Tannerella sp.]|jgi:hypothetical protein|nr:hypothetical protein [Tannerella sp.]
MKQFLLFAVFISAFFACSGNKNQADTSATPLEIDQLLAVADQKIDHTVTVVGYVTHTCKHSGKKCFIVGESQELSLRVEAQGEIETFSPELIGSKLAITGTLKEQQLSKEYIDNMENEVKLMQAGETISEEACATELSNISDMRKWMKDHNKDYYSMYYMDGLKYEVLN